MSSTIRKIVGSGEAVDLAGEGGDSVDLWASVAVAIHLAGFGDHGLKVERQLWISFRSENIPDMRCSCKRAKDVGAATLHCKPTN